jgi:hypothetical protein
MTLSRLFWIAVAVVTYPALVLGACLLAVMPPINIVLIPPWIMLTMGAVGAISNRIAEAGDSAPLRLAKRARRLPRPADEGLVEGALIAKA